MGVTHLCTNFKMVGWRSIPLKIKQRILDIKLSKTTI